MAGAVKGAQSFSRSIEVLQKISESPDPASLPYLLTNLDFTRPTLYRILASLEAEGLIKKREDKRYELGLRLVSLARKALAQNDIRKISREFLEHLRDRTGETVHLAVRSGQELVYVDKIESKATVRMSSTIGTRVPFHSSAVGKAFLSALPPLEAEEVISNLTLEPVTKFTNTDPHVLRSSVAETRIRGFVFDDQENEEAIVCFGAAICSASGAPVASVSVSVPLFRLGDDRDWYSQPLMECTAQISSLLGDDA
jgi:IclR family transcriptional regulator, KDG regulon repressor